MLVYRCFLASLPFLLQSTEFRVPIPRVVVHAPPLPSAAPLSADAFATCMQYSTLPTPLVAASPPPGPYDAGASIEAALVEIGESSLSLPCIFIHHVVRALMTRPAICCAHPQASRHRVFRSSSKSLHTSRSSNNFCNSSNFSSFSSTRKRYAHRAAAFNHFSD